jgi:hypothetical protein
MPAGRPRKPVREKRSWHIGVYLTPLEYQVVLKAATEAGMTVTRWIREVVARALR